MKKLLILLILIPALCSGQDPGLEALFLAYQPVDNGLGLRIDYQVGNIPLYGSLTYGRTGLYGYNGIGPHTKITLGGRIPLKNLKEALPVSKFFITAGVNYHYLGPSKGEYNEQLDPRVFHPWSFELGTTIYLGRFAFGAATDILRWEPQIAIGIVLNKRKKNCK